MLAFEDFTDEMQWRADTVRLMKIGLRSHDRDLLADVHSRICERYTPHIAATWLAKIVNQLMISEDWSFDDKNAKDAPAQT